MRTWGEKVRIQGNMSKGIGRDGKYRRTKWAVTDLLLLGNGVCKSHWEDKVAKVHWGQIQEGCECQMTKHWNLILSHWGAVEEFCSGEWQEDLFCKKPSLASVWDGLGSEKVGAQ